MLLMLVNKQLNILIAQTKGFLDIMVSCCANFALNTLNMVSRCVFLIIV
jgi:hypothetical protein